jgi:hypothetical protein
MIDFDWSLQIVAKCCQTWSGVPEEDAGFGDIKESEGSPLLTLITHLAFTYFYYIYMSSTRCHLVYHFYPLLTVVPYCFTSGADFSVCCILCFMGDAVHHELLFYQRVNCFQWAYQLSPLCCKKLLFQRWCLYVLVGTGNDNSTVTRRYRTSTVITLKSNDAIELASCHSFAKAVVTASMHKLSLLFYYLPS